MEFLVKWSPWENWDLVIIVEDNPTKTFDLGMYKEDVVHLAWDDIDADLGEQSWIISHRDSAIRSYGFYYAWKQGADYIFTLDDDCYPQSHTDVYFTDGPHYAKQFVAEHIQAMAHWTRWTESVHGWRTRGIPYNNKGALTNVVLNVGWWDTNPDLDAVQTLSGGEENWKGFDHYRKHEIIPNGQYFPMCGMNLCFKKEAAPLMFFPLMGEGYPYKRLDDIWCGIIMKKVCDHLRWSVSVGLPFIDHIRASDPFVNLVKEAPGIAANEWFWETIDAIKLTEDSPAECMMEIGIEIGTHQNDYLQKLGEAIQIWSSLFQSIE
jgi:reversibly glycosylated polypeptide/UDP-arabinopyranose mutase